MVGTLRRVGISWLGVVVLIGAMVATLTAEKDLAVDLRMAVSPAADIGCDCQRFMVPLYPSNTDEWDQAVASDMPPGSILILNVGGTSAPDDPWGALGGPGTRRDPDMLRRVQEAQHHGYYVLGYIRTGKSGSNDGPRRDRAYTDREIRDLKAWYDVDGIFYDEVFASSDFFDYYEELVAYGRQIVPGLHVLHAGGPPAADYARLADIIGTFEGAAEDFLGFSLESWQRSYPDSHWAAGVMDVDNADEMRTVMRHSRDRNIGYIYATDQFGGPTENPWTRLPPYWSELVKKLKQCWEQTTATPVNQPEPGQSTCSRLATPAAIPLNITSKKNRPSPFLNPDNRRMS